jgi:hypothetical protein
MIVLLTLLLGLGYFTLLVLHMELRALSARYAAVLKGFERTGWVTVPIQPCKSYKPHCKHRVVERA